MAKPTPNAAAEPIDVDEILPEEIPAELLERMLENHPHLRVMSLQVKRGGTWKELRGGRRTFQESPPSMQPTDLCALLVRAARQDAEQSGAEGVRYRVRLRCREGTHEYSRFANVRGYLDDEGAMQLVDDDRDDDNSAMRFLQAQAQQSASIAFQSLAAIVGCVKGFAEIADTFNKVLGAAGMQWSNQVNQQVELLKVQMTMEQNSQAHQERMKKYDRGFALLEGPVGRLGDEMVGFAIDAMKNKRRQQQRERHHARAAGNGSAQRKPEPKSEGAETLDGIFEDLTEEKIKAAREVMNDEEWKLIEVARRAPSDAEFQATFARFLGTLKQRGPDGTTAWVNAMLPIVGPQAILTLGELFKRIEQPEQPAASP